DGGVPAGVRVPGGRPEWEVQRPVQAGDRVGVGRDQAGGRGRAGVAGGGGGGRPGGGDRRGTRISQQRRSARRGGAGAVGGGDRGAAGGRGGGGPSGPGRVGAGGHGRLQAGGGQDHPVPGDQGGQQADRRHRETAPRGRLLRLEGGVDGRVPVRV